MAALRTWAITANGSTAYLFSGFGYEAGEDNPGLVLERGQEYTFTKVDSAHPFQLQLAAGLGEAAYSVGVTGDYPLGAGSFSIIVANNAPDVLYYQCTAHAGMFGVINVVDNVTSVNGDVGDVDVDTDLNLWDLGDVRGTPSTVNGVWNYTTNGFDGLSAGSWVKGTRDDGAVGLIILNNVDLNGVDFSAGFQGLVGGTVSVLGTGGSPIDFTVNAAEAATLGSGNYSCTMLVVDENPNLIPGGVSITLYSIGGDTVNDGQSLVYDDATQQWVPGDPSWNNLTDKPTEFPPEDHNHVFRVQDADDFGLQTGVDFSTETTPEWSMYKYDRSETSTSNGEGFLFQGGSGSVTSAVSVNVSPVDNDGTDQKAAFRAWVATLTFPTTLTFRIESTWYTYNATSFTDSGDSTGNYAPRFRFATDELDSIPSTDLLGGSYAFQIREFTEYLLSVTPIPLANGDILQWNSERSKFEPVVLPSSGAVDSVNGETGSVSLGIQDMDDYEYSPDSFRFNVLYRTVPGPGEIGTSNTTDENYLYISKTDQDGKTVDLSLLQADVAAALADPNNVDFPSIYNLNGAFGTTSRSVYRVNENATFYELLITGNPVEGTGGRGWPYANCDSGCNPLTNSFPDGAKMVFGVLTPPNGNVLQWSDTDQKFKPAQLPAGVVPPVDSVNGETGVVSLGIQDMDDFELNVPPGPPPEYRYSYRQTYSASMCSGGNAQANTFFQLAQVDAYGVDSKTYVENLLINDSIWVQLPGQAFEEITLLDLAWDLSNCRFYFKPLPVGAESLVDGDEVGVSFSNPGSAQPPTQLAEGDILQWNDTEQAFKPAALVDNDTKRIQEMDDYQPLVPGTKIFSNYSPNADLGAGELSGGMWKFLADGEFFYLGDEHSGDLSVLQDNDVITLTVGNDPAETVTVRSVESNAVWTSLRIYAPFPSVFTTGIPAGTSLTIASAKFPSTGKALENGDILQWDDSLQKFKAAQLAAGGGGAVDSVNGETGVVSLGIQDMDDFELGQIPPGTPAYTGYWDTKTAGGSGNYPEQQGEWFTLTGISAAGQESILMLDDLDKDGNSFASIWTLIEATPADYSLRYTDANGINGPFQVTGLSVQGEGRAAIYWALGDYPGDSPAGEIYVEFIDNASAVEMPLAEGDVLQWNDTEQVFKPAQVAQSIQEMDDFGLQPASADPVFQWVYQGTKSSSTPVSGEACSLNNSSFLNYLFVANIGNDGQSKRDALLAINGEEVLISWSGGQWGPGVATIETNGADSVKFILDNNWVDVANRPDAGTLITVSRPGVPTVPLAEGDILQWNEVTQKFMPAQPSGAVDSVNGETGVVTLGIQDMDDFAKNQVLSPSNRTGIWNEEWPTHVVGQDDEYPALPGRWASYDFQDSDGSLPALAGRSFLFITSIDSEGVTVDVTDVVADPTSYGITFVVDGVAQPSVRLVDATIQADGDRYRLDWLATDLSGNTYGEVYDDENPIASPGPYSNTMEVYFSLWSTLSEAPLVDGEILQWVDAEQKFKPATLVDNDTKRIQDMDDFELAPLSNNVVDIPATTQDDEDIQSPANGWVDGLFYFTDSGASAAAFCWNINDSRHARLSQTSIGDTLLLTWDDNSQYTTTVATGVEVGLGAGYEDFRFIRIPEDAWPPIALTTATATIRITPAGSQGGFVPLAEGDILQWSEAQQKFIPAQPSGGGTSDFGGDPLFSKVTVLATFDGETDGASAWTTYGSTSPTWTTNGATISNAQTRWGGTTSLSVGAGTPSIPMQLGTDDWTIETWVWMDTTTWNAFGAVIKNGVLADTYETVYIGPNGSSNSFRFRVAENNAALMNISGSCVWHDKQWNHVAICRTGDTYSGFINGEKVGYGITSGRTFNSGDLKIGGSESSTAYVQDFRVTSGVARYSTEAYPVPGPGGQSGGSGGGGAVDSVNEKTGVVSLGIQDMDDFQYQSTGVPSFSDLTRSGTWSKWLDAHSDPPGYEFPSEQSEWRVFADVDDANGNLQIAALDDNGNDSEDWASVSTTGLLLLLIVDGTTFGPIPVESIVDSPSYGVYVRWALTDFDPTLYSWGYASDAVEQAPTSPRPTKEITVQLGYTIATGIPDPLVNGDILTWDSAKDAFVPERPTQQIRRTTGFLYPFY